MENDSIERNNLEKAAQTASAVVTLAYAAFGAVVLGKLAYDGVRITIQDHREKQAIKKAKIKE